MDLRIAGKIALVTGGSRGLGRAAALSLAGEGVNVAICGRSRETLDTTVGDLEALGVSSIGVIADVSDPASLDGLHNEVVTSLGSIDILVNNAGGSGSTANIEDTSLDDFKAIFDLNIFGSFRLMELVIPHMKQQAWGRIINIASIYGREYGGKLSYMAAKAALIAATNHAGRSLAKTGVLVNSIAPGSIKHPGGSWERYEQNNSAEVVEEFISQNLPMGKWGWPEPVGDMVTFLSSNRAGMITGACIPVDGGQGGSLI